MAPTAPWWRRIVGARPAPDDAPPTPGGAGGSGFGAVGGAPPAPGARGSRAGGTAEADVPRGLRAPGTPEEKRFSQVYAEDRVGPMPYPNQASPDVAAARGRVRALVDDLLPGAVDEGTGGALDPLIASWASGWLARIDSEHADHHAVIDRLIGGARRQLADAEAAHERDRRALEIARHDYADARERLMEPVGAPSDDGPGESSGGGPGLLRRAVGRAARGGAPAPLHPDPATGPIRVTPASYGTTQPPMPAGAPPRSGPPGHARAEPTDGSDEPVTDQPLDRAGRDRSGDRR